MLIKLPEYLAKKRHSVRLLEPFRYAILLNVYYHYYTINTPRCFLLDMHLFLRKSTKNYIICFAIQFQETFRFVRYLLSVYSLLNNKILSFVCLEFNGLKYQSHIKALKYTFLLIFNNTNFILKRFIVVYLVHACVNVSHLCVYILYTQRKVLFLVGILILYNTPFWTSSSAWKEWIWCVGM